MLNATNVLILLAVMAWVLQIVLGWWQVNRFNQAFMLLSKQGNVGIGRTKGRFKSKIVIVLAFNEDRYIVNNIVMKGWTVFSKPQSMPELNGSHYDEINPFTIFPTNKNAREALVEAIQLK